MNMKEDIDRIKQTHQVLSFVNKFLDENHDAELYLVGGAVRDLLMKRKMLDVDFDFVVRLINKKQIEKWFGSQGTIELVGKAFGVYKFMPSNMNPSISSFIDIALPRTEQSSAESLGGYKDFDIQSDETLPIIDDLSRRDFTINAMAINMRDGELIDPFNGWQDIERKLIRTVGEPEERFNEDMSRMLRATRFQAELHFSIEEKTLLAIQAGINGINNKRECDGKYEYIVPRETIGTELAKAISRNPAGAIESLYSTKALDVIFEPVAKIVSTDKNYLAPVKSVRQGETTLAVGLFMRAFDKTNILTMLAESGLDSLPRASKIRIEPNTIIWLVERLQESLNTQSIQQMKASLFEKYFMNGRADLLMEALRLTGNGNMADTAEDRANEIRTRWSVEKNEMIPTLLSGNDVLDSGINAGPVVRQLLEELRDEQLDGGIMTREEAKNWLNKKTRNISE